MLFLISVFLNQCSAFKHNVRKYIVSDHTFYRKIKNNINGLPLLKHH
ncbi:hypothetical protein EBCG_02216 [Escherichia marmotae]|nr:hypothetical protein EBCG_02216 [Escherichia marmotae]